MNELFSVIWTIWTFSTLLAWPLSATATPMVNSLPDYYRSRIKRWARVNAMICLISTLFVWHELMRLPSLVNFSEPTWMVLTTAILTTAATLLAVIITIAEYFYGGYKL